MKISHELPLSLLKYSFEWNDYEYCLPHLLDKFDKYRTHFQKCRLHRRFVIMDNGLFEGVTHTTEDLIDKINLIYPNIFIVPDAWNDAETTLGNAQAWIDGWNLRLPDDVNLMAVLQGETFYELKQCYIKLVDMGYNYIAINHSSKAYGPTLEEQMEGRIRLIDELKDEKIINKRAYHHLLGASLPQEFIHYKDSKYKFIESMDTSNPITVGAEGVKYDTYGIDFKPKNKLEHYFEKSLDEHLDNIIFNVQKFKTFVK